MIALLDKEVFAVDVGWADIYNVTEYYASGEHKKDILTVYKEETFYGMICFDSLFKYISHKSDDYILKYVYVHKYNDDLLWDNLHSLFLKTGAQYIPIFNQEGSLLYFAYEDLDGKKEEIKVIINNIKKNIKVFSIAGVRGIKIYNLNEIGFLFWELAVSNDAVPVETIGEKWDILYPEINEKICGIPEESIMEYYPEVNPREIIFGRKMVFHTIRDYYLISILDYCVDKLKHKGITVLTAYFSGALDEKTTIDEEYRRKIGLTPGVPENKWSEPLIRDQINKIEGCEITYYDWYSENDKKQWDYIKINGKLVFRKIFGEINRSDKIYLIGSCIVRGVHVKSFEESLGGCIWKRLNQMGLNYSVICISLDQNDLGEYQMVFDTLLLSENDIIILALQPNVDQWILSKSDIPVMDIMKKRVGDWFWDCPAHTTYAGNRALATEIVDKYLLSKCGSKKEVSEYLQIGREFLSETEKEALNNYIVKIKMARSISMDQNIGAIVMNCNPMTKGHCYLIEEARKRVDYLYIFVVEEDRADFSFEERFYIVKKETENMNNVIVVPSGQYIISYTTMPLYFEKEEKKNEQLDAANDLRIFGQYIAPLLGIKERFVGEEPFDLVTRQYNEEMKKILPFYKVRVTEIPRFMIEETVISASRVRKLLKEENWAEIQRLVPESTYTILYQQHDVSKI